MEWLITYSSVRFDSFTKLVELKEQNDDYKHSIILRYTGNDICGQAVIKLPAGDSKVREEFKLLAAKTLVIF